MLVLTLVHHPDVGFLGRQEPLKPGAAVVFGRKQPAFGEGALDDTRLSRRHCQVVQQPGGRVLVEDLTSRNGTFVNGDRVRVQALRVGDVIGFGGQLVLLSQQSDSLGVHSQVRLVGNGLAMSELMRELTRLAPGSEPVLVVGGPGTGRRRVAGELHRLSGHRGPFGVLDCGAGGLPPWERVRARIGEGVVLLAELEHAPAAVQRALRGWLRERTPGAEGLRVLATTSVSLSMLAHHGRFDAELAHLLEQRVLEVPALSERPEDVLPLAWGFARACSGGQVRLLSQRLALMLQLHRWPNNVRELKEVVQRLVQEQPDPTEPLKAPAWLLERLQSRGAEVAMLRLSQE